MFTWIEFEEICITSCSETREQRIRISVFGVKGVSTCLVCCWLGFAAAPTTTPCAPIASPSGPFTGVLQIGENF